MDISCEDALGILRKWRDESALVTGLIKAEGGSAFLSIGSLSVNDCAVQLFGEGGRIDVDFSVAERFAYGDWRLAPEDERAKAKMTIDSVVFAVFRSGSTALFYVAPSA